MNKILSDIEINNFKKDGAIFLKGKFDISWIKKLEKGIERDIKNLNKHSRYVYISYLE